MAQANTVKTRHSLAKRFKKICKLEKNIDSQKKVMQQQIMVWLSEAVEFNEETYEDGMKVQIVVKSDTSLDVKALAKYLKIDSIQLEFLLKKFRKETSISTYPLVTQ